MKINLKVMFLITAIYWTLNGLLGLVVPVSVVGVLLDASTPMFLVMAGGFGV